MQHNPDTIPSHELNSFDQEELPSLVSAPVRNYGNLHCVWRGTNGQPVLQVGPHYPLFIISWLICLVLISILIYHNNSSMSFIWSLLTTFSSVGFLLSFLNVGLSVPGVASSAIEPSLEEQNSPRYCRTCKIVRGRRTEHCGDCDVCILELDHHCPWIGKCVGRDNINAFYVFIFMTFGNLILTFIATMVNAVIDGQNSVANNTHNLAIQT